MPTNTFFHLPAAKKKRLLNAAWQEFSQHSFSDSSINRIVQSAGIPRGSFYQYFTDKEDLFLYLLQDTEKPLRKQLICTFRSCQKDLYSTLLTFFDDLYLHATVPTASQFQMQNLLKQNPLLDWQPRLSSEDKQLYSSRRHSAEASMLQLQKEQLDLIFCYFSSICKRTFFSPENVSSLRQTLAHTMNIILHNNHTE